MYKLWAAIQDAKCDYYYITVRRLTLKEHNDLPGADTPVNCHPTWRNGALPSCDERVG